MLDFPIQTLHAASAAARNGGTNPFTYVASAPVLGSTWSASVTLNTGHTMATVLGMSASDQFLLPGGQTALIGGFKIFQLPLQTGPLASWSAPIPNDASLIGQTVYTQGVHLFGVSPFLLTNAQDLTVGL